MYFSNHSNLKYKIFQVEVKSTNTYSTVSLERFRERFRERIGACYVVHPKNLSAEGEIIRIPAYMAFCL